MGRVGGALVPRESRSEPTVISSKYNIFSCSSSSISDPSYFSLDDRKSGQKSKMKMKGFSFLMFNGSR